MSHQEVLVRRRRWRRRKKRERKRCVCEKGRSAQTGLSVAVKKSENLVIDRRGRWKAKEKLEGHR